ncbi:MAG: glycine dehydrogenase, partial [Actinomycetota bacterium]|nr:glycine dehydrogenase [Actinomycetota bacterium]
MTEPACCFADRHIGPDRADVARMLAVIGKPDLDALIDEAMPASIRTSAPGSGPGGGPGLPEPVGESEALAELAALARRNVLAVPMIG